MDDGKRSFRAGAGMTLILAFAAGLVTGRSADAETPPASDGAETPPYPSAPDTWTVSLTAYAYAVPDGDSYVQPTLTLERDALHFEGRFNYEDRNTASVWAGWRFDGVGALAWEFTPMIGGVFGQTRGIAPGYRGAVRWRWLEFYSEGEYLYNTEESDDSYFYTWNELTATVVEWLRFGLVTQRTRTYDTDHALQRGFLVGVDLKKASMTLNVFNPDDDRPTYVVSVGVNF